MATANFISLNEFRIPIASPVSKYWPILLRNQLRTLTMKTKQICVEGIFSSAPRPISLHSMSITQEYAFPQPRLQRVTTHNSISKVTKHSVSNITGGFHQLHFFRSFPIIFVAIVICSLTNKRYAHLTHHFRAEGGLSTTQFLRLRSAVVYRHQRRDFMYPRHLEVPVAAPKQACSVTVLRQKWPLASVMMLMLFSMSFFLFFLFMTKLMSLASCVERLPRGKASRRLPFQQIPLFFCPFAKVQTVSVVERLMVASPLSSQNSMILSMVGVNF